MGTITTQDNLTWHQPYSDERPVGARTPVYAKTDPTNLLSGWAEISRVADRKGPQILVGPIYSSEHGTFVLDQHPIFSVGVTAIQRAMALKHGIEQYAG